MSVVWMAGYVALKLCVYIYRLASMRPSHMFVTHAMCTNRPHKQLYKCWILRCVVIAAGKALSHETWRMQCLSLTCIC